jgi:hypothetical protein
MAVPLQLHCDHSPFGSEGRKQVPENGFDRPQATMEQDQRGTGAVALIIEFDPPYRPLFVMIFFPWTGEMVEAAAATVNAAAARKRSRFSMAPSGLRKAGK